MKNVHGIWLPDHDEHFERMLRNSEKLHGRSTYQLKKYKAALPYVKRRELALDIGGHVGLWAFPLCHDFASVHVFEPVAEHRACFLKNIKPCTNYVLHACAVSDTPDTLFMETPPDNTGHTQVSLVDKGEAVRAITLDDMEFPTCIDFIKIDVEGFELRVVQGAEQTIRDHRPVIIIEQKPNGNAERFGAGQHSAVKLLKSWGMREVRVISGDHIMVW